MFSLANHSSMMHTFVDSFFEAKKVIVKARLRDSMEAIVDDLFVEMVGQFKEMFLPPKETKMPLKSKAQKQPTTQATSTLKPNFQSKSNFYEVYPKLSGQKRAFSENEEELSTYSSSAKKVKENLLDELTQVEEDNWTAECAADDDNLGLYENKETERFSDETRFSEKCKNIKVEFDDDISTTTEIITTPPSLISGKFTSNIAAFTSKSGAESKTEKNLKCTEEGCDKSYPKKRELDTHIRTVHTKVKPYVCSFNPKTCSFASAERSSTIKHIRNVHLKKVAAKTSTAEGDSSEPPDQDPVKYLTVKEELL